MPLIPVLHSETLSQRRWGQRGERREVRERKRDREEKKEKGRGRKAHL